MQIFLSNAIHKKPSGRETERQSQRHREREKVVIVVSVPVVIGTLKKVCVPIKT